MWGKVWAFAKPALKIAAVGAIGGAIHYGLIAVHLPPEIAAMVATAVTGGAYAAKSPVRSGQ